MLELDLDDVRAKAYMVADNKLTDESAWDYKALENVMRDLQALSFELESTGFDSGEILEIMRDYKEETDPTPPLPIEPITKYGDLFELGNHRLFCGDATKKEDFEKLMNGQKAKLVFTDPPYSVDYRSTAGNSYSEGKFEKYNGQNAIFNDDKTPDEALGFYVSTLKNIFDNSTDGASLYWWFANKMNWINRLAWLQSNWFMAQIVVWLKESMIFSIGQDYHRCYEPCMFGWKKGNSHYTNKKIANYKDVFSLDVKAFSDLYDVWYERRDRTTEYVHPTQKPVGLAHRALRKNSEKGDIVLDCFGGSGSTLIACEQMDRRCFMMELDPKFCDVIIRRYSNFMHIPEETIFESRLVRQ